MMSGTHIQKVLKHSAKFQISALKTVEYLNTQNRYSLFKVLLKKDQIQIVIISVINEWHMHSVYVSLTIVNRFEMIVL